MTDLLQTVTGLSHEFGGPEYVKGGGGNSSVKDEQSLWVKPSGTTLSGLTPDRFVAMNRAKLGVLYDTPMPEGSAAREALVKDLMMAAVKPGEAGRPSVEAPLHDILSGTFVVHTHPALVNGMTCSREGATACARLFPEALWVPYVDPGFTLCMAIREVYAGQRVVILENHGIFVSGDTADDIRNSYHEIMETLQSEYDRAGVATSLSGSAPDEAEPVTPDHIVYAKKPGLGEVMAEDSALIRQLAEAFGGIQLLDERSQQFIENWEVEAFRQTQV